MHLLTFLALVISCSVIQSADLVLKASSRVIVDGVTEQLTLECKPSSSWDSETNRPIYMDVYRYDDSGANFVARQVSDTTEFKEDNKTSAEGNFGNADSDDPTYLKVTILEPSYSDEGVYKCRLLYLENDIDVVTKAQSVNITVVDVPPPDYVPDVPQDNEVVAGCDCDDIWKEINALKAGLSLGTNNPKQEVQNYGETCRVSFSAKFSGQNGYAIENFGIAPFNEVISNQGDAFDADKSVFVAPCTGQYFLSLTLRSQQELDSGYVDGLILVDGEEVARTSVFVDAPITNYESATNGAVVSLQQGQEVTVQIRSTSFGTFKSSAYSIFSGFYLFP